MAVSTKNYYGDIEIFSDAIAAVAGFATLDSYGVVDLVTNMLSDSLRVLFRKKYKPRGIKISTVNDRIVIDLQIILKYGVSINAVADSVKKLVKYNVEQFTGMIVDSININVVGVKV